MKATERRKRKAEHRPRVYKTYNHNSIYMIKNNVSNKPYIGRSVNPERRISAHFQALRRGEGYKDMQKDFDNYGEESFEAKILETHSTDEHDPREREDHYIKKYNSIKEGYNKRYSVPKGVRQLSTSLTTKQNKQVQKLVSKKGITASKWIKKLILRELERESNNDYAES